MNSETTLPTDDERNPRRDASGCAGGCNAARMTRQPQTDLSDWQSSDVTL